MTYTRKISRRRPKWNLGGSTLTIAAGLLFLLFLYLHEPQNHDRQKIIELMERSILSPLNRGACHQPTLPVNYSEIMKFYTKSASKLNCGNISDDWVQCENSRCSVKSEIIARHGEVICLYIDLIHKTDSIFEYGIPVEVQEPYILQNSDFVMVECNSVNGESNWQGIVYGIRNNAENTMEAPAAFAEAASLAADDSTYFNVLVLGIDSMSRNAVIRQLPKTYKYLTAQLNATVLKGYNIVGDGTLQALVPLLTGYNELELPGTRKNMPGSNYNDVYPMIWKKFQQAGYVTSFNEDDPSGGTFGIHRMNGFKSQPVDHYLHTFYAEHGYKDNDNGLCVGHQPHHAVLLDYTKKFMTYYKDWPHFAFSFHRRLSYDSTNWISAVDDDIAAWLQELLEKHLLDNTILIFMSDHGNRFSEERSTLQGKQEERLPFFSFTFPETFKQRFPQQYANFLQNSERLTTPYDIHATLEQLIKIQKSHSSYAGDLETSEDIFEPIQVTQQASKRSISLFDFIPANRSCSDAYIEPHWCACLHWDPLPLHYSTYADIILRVAEEIINTLNEAIRNYRNLCAPLELHRIHRAMRLLPHKKMQRFEGNHFEDGFLGDFRDRIEIHQEFYQLQIITIPGEALYEATVAYNMNTFEACTKLSDISRINRYDTHSKCIAKRNPELRKFCYCHG